MCGRFNNHVEAMHDWVDVLKDWPGEFERGYNVAPTQQVPIVTATGTVSARWGLIPTWAPEFKSKYTTFNARIESVQKSPGYRGAWKHSRTCLVPAAGYYEWVTEEGKSKQPYYFYRPEDLIVLAGLWEPWQDRISFTIITEEARGDLANLHDRMPVMLDPAQAEAWLGEGTQAAEAILVSTVYQSIRFFPVSPRVNSARNQGADLIEPVDVETAVNKIRL